MSVLAAAMLLGGCAVGPDFEMRAPDAPADWSSWQSGDASLRDPVLRGNQAPVPARWWTRFGDPVLDALEARALSANPDLKTAALRFVQSRTQRGTVAAQGGPRIGANAAATRQRQSENGAETRLIDAIAPTKRDELVQALSEPFNLYQAGFDASWEIDLWGRVRRSIEAADADVASAGAALDGVRLAVAAEVARNYFELRGVQRQLRLTRADLAAGTDSLGLVQARVDGGVASDLDATRQRAALAESRARLPLLVAQEAQMLGQLSLLLGERPGALQVEVSGGADAPGLPHALPDFGLGLPSEVARRRPDIVQAESKLHSATAAIGVAVADFYPRITLNGSFGYESAAADRFSDWGSRRWAVGPSLDIPIFDMGRRRHVVTLRRLQAQEAAVAYQQTVLKAWHEIDTALAGYTAQRQRDEQLAARERHSRDASQLARVRYERGLTSFLEDLDAQRTLLAAQREQADSETQMAVQLVAIFKALGAPTVEP